MAVQVTNFNIYQGSTLLLVLRLTDPTTGAPVDYTGFTAQGMIRVNYADTEPAGVFTCEFQDASLGILEVSMTDEQTAELDFTKAYYDIEVQDSAGIVNQILRGQVTLFRNATK